MVREDKRLSVLLVFLVTLMLMACGVSYSNPPEAFHDLDLVGTWEAHYEKGDVDQLIIRADGSFKQTYQDGTVEDYVYETTWNEWWLERFDDGRVLLHLEGARYYLAGISVAEEDGMLPGSNWPSFFYDPFADESIDMVRKLILNVQTDSSGELILHHMWTGSDRGFALIGGEKEVFRRVETP